MKPSCFKNVLKVEFIKPLYFFLRIPLVYFNGQNLNNSML